MNWCHRLFTTGYFLCLMLFAASIVTVGDVFFHQALSDAPYWSESYVVVLVLLGFPASFLVLRDLSRRPGLTSAQKRGWAGLFLMFWPSVLVYLVRHEWMARTRAHSVSDRG
ncbi:MAG: hypothetical protein WBC44_07960 [Planctomycetaceae bacterium]